MRDPDVVAMAQCFRSAGVGVLGATDSPKESAPPLPPSPLAANREPSSPDTPPDVLAVWRVDAASCIRNTLAIPIVLAVMLYAGDSLLGTVLPDPTATWGAPGAIRPGLIPAPVGTFASVLFACVSLFAINALAPTVKGFRMRLGEATTWPGSRRELARINPGSALKVGVTCGALLGAVAACLTSVVFQWSLGLPMGWEAAGGSAGAIAFVSLIALYAVSTGVSAVMGAVVYNQLALRWGGILFGTAEDEADETAYRPAHERVGRRVRLKSVSSWQVGIAGALVGLVLAPFLGVGAVLSEVLTSGTPQQAASISMAVWIIALFVVYGPPVGCLFAWILASLYDLAASITGGLEITLR